MTSTKAELCINSTAESYKPRELSASEFAKLPSQYVEDCGPQYTDYYSFPNYCYYKRRWRFRKPDGSLIYPE